MHKDVFRFAYAMNYVFQVTFCMLTPAALWIGAGWYLHHRLGVGKWVFVLAIVLGVITGVVSMFRFLLTSAHAIDPTSPEQKGEKDRESK